MFVSFARLSDSRVLDARRTLLDLLAQLGVSGFSLGRRHGCFVKNARNQLGVSGLGRGKIEASAQSGKDGMVERGEV